MQDDMVRILASPRKPNIVHEGQCQFLEDHIGYKVQGLSTPCW